MPLSNKRSDTFLPLLQDLQKKLGDNYTFYQECVVAIARAAAYQQDASAWYEQMERVVEGDEAAAISHGGVTILLGEMERGEVTSKTEMPPPPLPLRLQAAPQPHAMNLLVFTPSPAPLASATPASSPGVLSFKALKAQPSCEEEAVSLSRNPHHDAIFFTDSGLKHQIAIFFNTIPSSANTAGYDMRTQHPFNYDATYNYPENFGPRYDPAADDLEVFKAYVEREEREAMVNGRKMMMTEREKLLREVSEKEAGVLLEPLLVQPHNYTKGRRGGKRR